MIIIGINNSGSYVGKIENKEAVACSLFWISYCESGSKEDRSWKNYKLMIIEINNCESFVEKIGNEGTVDWLLLGSIIVGVIWGKLRM